MFLFFNLLLRFTLFWVIVGAVLMLASQHIPWIDVPRVIETVKGAFQPGGLEAVSEKEFAFSLASLIFAFAVAMAIAFGLCHVLPVLWTLRLSTGRINRGVKRKSTSGEIRRKFASNFDQLRPRLERNRLVGHAWAEFVETLYDTNSETEIRNTVRPQAFFNPGLARERLGGLKMISSVPGYFVGVGLLLTFIGLVIALYKAGNAASAANAEAMVGEMGGLLQIATFKFATSIAGLGASIVLSIIFRWYAILIEGSFDQFNAALERSLLYESPQSISLEMKRTLRDQLDQLKDITQGQFFTRMGETMAPRLSEAISQAMKPVADNIESAVGNLTTNSRDGVQDLVKNFAESVNHGAGTELRELAATLKQLQMSMVETQSGLRGSGDDFARKLSDAADNLNRMVENAGQSFEKSSGESRDALTSVVETLRQTLEKANVDMDASLGNAAKGASDKLEAAMGGIDIVIFDHKTRDLHVVSVKRGGGAQGGRKARDAREDLTAAGLMLKNIMLRKGLPVLSVKKVLVDWYGRSGIVARKKVTRETVDAYFGLPIASRVEAMSAYLESSIAARMAPRLLAAIGITSAPVDTDRQVENITSCPEVRVETSAEVASARPSLAECLSVLPLRRQGRQMQSVGA